STTCTIYPVIVCIDSVTSSVSVGVEPAATDTIIVSPIAREIPNTNDAIIPDSAAGTTTFKATSSLVDPMASAPSLIELGTELMASSESEAIIGMIMTPTIIPGLSALKIGRSGMNTCSSGVTNVSAKNPYTIVGIPD